MANPQNPMNERPQAPYGDTTSAPAKTIAERRKEWAKKRAALIGLDDAGAQWRVYYWLSRDDQVASITGETPEAALDAAMEKHP